MKENFKRAESLDQEILSLMAKENQAVKDQELEMSSTTEITETFKKQNQRQIFSGV